jgi:hypothetical protein
LSKDLIETMGSYVSFFDRKDFIKKKERKAKVQNRSTHTSAKIGLVAVRGTKHLSKKKQGNCILQKEY